MLQHRFIPEMSGEYEMSPDFPSYEDKMTEFKFLSEIFL